LTTEAFTFESFKEVEEASDERHHREHVTPYYRENPDEFDLYNVTSDEVFEEEFLHDRTDLRLTLDEADDYELLRRIYEGVEYDGIIDVTDAVRYVDEKRLSEINQHVEQKKV
jgi:spore coat polysaccharide biosynthesis protein SpsF